jgi:hypothetical protein
VKDLRLPFGIQKSASSALPAICSKPDRMRDEPAGKDAAVLK